METGKLTAYEAYKIVLGTRNFEIKLFWQRSNYFLVLNTALAVGVFEGKHPFILAAFGVIVSVLWFCVTLGSKFWQSRWEQRLSMFEGCIAPEVKFFSADWETIRADVQSSLLNGGHKGLHKQIDRLVMRKFSVSYIMILLSLIFIVGWVVILVMQFVK